MISTSLLLAALIIYPVAMMINAINTENLERAALAFLTLYFSVFPAWRGELHIPQASETEAWIAARGRSWASRCWDSSARSTECETRAVALKRPPKSPKMALRLIVLRRSCRRMMPQAKDARAQAKEAVAEAKDLAKRVGVLERKDEERDRQLTRIRQIVQAWFRELRAQWPIEHSMPLPSIEDMELLGITAPRAPH